MYLQNVMQLLAQRKAQMKLIASKWQKKKKQQHSEQNSKNQHTVFILIPLECFIKMNSINYNNPSH